MSRARKVASIRERICPPAMAKAIKGALDADALFDKAVAAEDHAIAAVESWRSARGQGERYLAVLAQMRAIESARAVTALRSWRRWIPWATEERVIADYEAYSAWLRKHAPSPINVIPLRPAGAS